MMVSVLVIPVSAANTSDTKYKYEWTSSARYDYTPPRKKTNSTPVYIKTVEYTLPYGGYYVRTFYGPTSTNASSPASLEEYWIGNYTAYTIRSNAASKDTEWDNTYIRIRGHYTETAYSWGDCTTLWSPDTANASQYVSLN